MTTYILRNPSGVKIMIKLKSYIIRFYIPIIILLLLGYTAKINWGNGQWDNVLEADAKGYYAYLPALFIYDDLNFQFYDEVEVQNAYDTTLTYDYRAYYNEKCVNKYFVGESVLLMPFFIVAHFTSGISGSPTDGYSRLYVISVTIAALFYLLCGLLALKKTLELFEFSNRTIFIAISTLVFGTNLFYYSVGEMGTTHVYSFSLISIFIYQMTKYFQSLHVKHILYGALFLGLIILIRPINGIVIFSIPFLSLNINRLNEGFRKYLSRPDIIALSIGIVLAIISIQLIIYWIQTGSFFVYSYGEEGFNFSSPQLLNFLFSYRKGFFLYTPIALLSLLGFIYLRTDRFKFITLFLFLLLVVYVLSSWWMWYYGGSFSSRVMVDYLPFFGILLCLLLKGVSELKVRYAFLGLLFLFVILNQVQTLQYRYYIIHWSDMNKETYWQTFMDISPIIDRKTVE